MKQRDFIRKTAKINPGCEQDIQDILVDERNFLIKAREFAINHPKGSRPSKMTREKYCAELKISMSTLYEYRNRFEKTGTLSGMRASVSSGGRGKFRIPMSTVDFIRKNLSKRERDAPDSQDAQIVRMLQEMCEAQGLYVPSPNTVLSIMKESSTFERAARRKGIKTAKSNHDARPGKKPKSHNPLDRIQIDHTLVDQVVTDHGSRFAIGRPWITVGFDECTESILGFLLTFEYPSATSLAFFMTRMISRKESYMEDLGLGSEFPWPMHGIPRSIYVDNGMDFRSEAFLNGCLEHNIPMPEHRPPNEPFYGGTIERTIGTLMGEMKLCSGSTSREWQGHNRTYNPEEKAEMTFKELERYLATFIAGRYNLGQRKSLNWLSPKAKWEAAFKDSPDRIGIPQPRLPMNQTKLTLDFLASETRTIQSDGITFKNITYWDEALRAIVRRHDKREYHFKWNHYDLSRIWVRIPETGQYVSVANKERGFGSFSLFEWKAVDRWLKQQGYSKADGKTRLKALRAMRHIRENAKTSKEKKRRHKEVNRIKQTQEISDHFLPPNEIEQASLSSDDQPLALPDIPRVRSPIRKLGK